MIDKPEIDLMSERLGVHTAHVQRDYAFGWLLAGMFDPGNALSRLLHLKGGNCFRKAYFESARYSSDLDFGMKTEVDPELLLSAIKKACEFAKSHSGIEFLVDDSTVNAKRVDKSFSAFEARIYFRSFYGEHEDLRIKVSVDVREYDAVYLPIQNRRLIHDYSDSEICKADLKCLKLEELLAQKLKALLMRQHSPDLFDFVHAVFFQKTLAVVRPEILSTFFKLSIYEQDPKAAMGLLLQLPFEVIRGFWAKYVSCPKPSLFTFDNAADWFKQTVAEIFSLTEPKFSAAGSGWGPMPYFSAESRATMLEAGRLKRILRVQYDGYERLVEPYALAFKKAKDASPREYFYVYDTTGGRSGQQGTKSFVADKLGMVEMTDQEFEPKFTIELAKGGGYFGRPDFTRPGRTRDTVAKAPSRRSQVRTPFGMTYKFQCPMCNKIFTRNSYAPELNAHKDKYGNSCYGRFGYQV